jgi:hypothetical protein
VYRAAARLLYVVTLGEDAAAAAAEALLSVKVPHAAPIAPAIDLRSSHGVCYSGAVHANGGAARREGELALRLHRRAGGGAAQRGAGGHGP